MNRALANPSRAEACRSLEIENAELRLRLAEAEALLGRKERELAEAASQQRQLKSLAHHASVPLYLIDLQGRVTFANPAAEAAFGWSSEELRGQVLHDLVRCQRPDGSRFPVGECPLGRLMSPGHGVQNHEGLFHARDGRPVHVRCWNAPVLESGAPSGVVLVVEDVTEHKQYEERLRRAHHTVYHLIQNSPFGIYLVDADFRLHQVSLGAQKVFSNVRPLLGRDFAEVLRTVWPEPFANAAIERFRHTLATGEPYASPRTVERRADIGELESYDWRIERIALPDGRFGVVCYFYDLSERQRWEAELRQSQERFEVAARAANDAIWDWDLSTNSLWWNEGVRTLFGYMSDQVRADNDWWSANVHPDDRVRVFSGIRKVIDSGQPFWRDEYRFRRADGSYATVFDRGFVIRGPDGKAQRMLGAMQDQTERKNAEAALAQAQHELQEHANRLEETVAERTATLRETIAELEALSYSISHDMRAPLRAMQGFSQAVLEDCRSRMDLEGVFYLERISKAAQRLDSLIQDILLFTKVSREKLELKPVFLEPLIRETIRTYHPDQESCVTIQGSMPVVLGHEAFLSQILSNLLTNALKFVKKGRVPCVTVRAEEQGDFVKIVVEDEGIGIAPEHLDRIFQVFGRVHSEAEYPGTGIGLAIVKRAVQRLGGEAGVDSEPGRGSRFWFTLRRA